jgi:putative holliday junction resolvase
VRILGVDFGRRRVGLAISDPSCTLARPLATLTLDDERQAVNRLLKEVSRLATEPDGLGGIVVGVPTRLDGSASGETPRIAQFVADLRAHANLPVFEEDERLTSREAESRLALRERDWRRRKARIDAAAAAIILQDYLDRQRG